MKKRLLTTVIAALAAVLCAFVFVACGGGKSVDNHPADTFYTGTLSAETYATPELAAKAFIDTEIKGEVTDATFVSYVKTTDLTAEEVEALNIPDEERAEIASVEKGEVKYTVAGGESDITVRTSASEEKSYFVIIVRYNNQTVKYYAPMINTGDPLTKSYYDQVFSADNFKNVTLQYKMDIPIKVSVSGMKFTTKVSIKIDGKWDDDSYGYFKSTSVVDLGALGSLAGGDKQTVVTEHLFVNDKTSRFYECSFSRTTMNGDTSEWLMSGAVKAPDWSYGADDESEETDEGGESDWGYGEDDDNDMLSKFMPAFDYSYFVKTKTGFKINSEKLTEYMNIALKDAFEQSSAETMGIKLGKTTATADYYVSDGKITESVVKVNCKYTLDASGIHADYVMNEKIVTKYSNYGATVVVAPADIDFDSYL